MKVAFHAPLKAPDHPVPSGDRQLGRALLHALRAGGHDVSVVSRFRSFDGAGNGTRQARLAELGARIAQRLVARYRRTADRPDVWFTYHVYHKAPDWLGPAVTRALGIPYVLAEASIADKQRDGAWAFGHAAAVAAVRSADAVICLNPGDVAGIRRVRGNIDTTDLMPPFLDVDAFRECAVPAPRPSGRHARVQMIAVAMMRQRAKLASYRVLAAALARVRYAAWELTIVGDGPARAEVETAFAEFGAHRIHFTGAMTSAQVAAQLGQSDLFVWPAVDEAFGMAFIEAQACGLPVVGGNAGGVAAVVDDGRTGLLVTPGDAEAFAAATERLLRDAPLRMRMGREALAYIRSRHDLPAAAARLDDVLRRVAAARAATASAAAVAT
jgi:glycosyltransferase involved in cell wall biosynthesis